MTIAALAREEIRALKPYQAAVQVDDTVRMNANEAPWTSGSDRFRRPLNRYPEIRPAKLRASLAERFGCDESNLLVTRGSSEAIDMLIRVFCHAGVNNIVTTAPSFSMYSHYAAIQGADVHRLVTKPEDSFRVHAGEVLAHCDASTRIVFLCSPNNPTGTTVDAETLQQVLAALADQAAVVVDEAYIEFSEQGSSVALLDRYDNLIVLRTLSKALACAGARCGAAIGPVDVIDMLNAVQAPYALATPVVECIETALSDRWLSEAERRVSEIVRARDQLVSALVEFPFVEQIWKSDANFFLTKVRNVGDVLAQSQKDGILLRFFDGDLENCVRITVGNADDNNKLLQSLANIGTTFG